jgi:hypothetical protein
VRGFEGTHHGGTHGACRTNDENFMSYLLVFQFFRRTGQLAARCQSTFIQVSLGVYPCGNGSDGSRTSWLNEVIQHRPETLGMIAG